MQPLNGAVFALDGILIGASDGPFLAWSMVAAFAASAVVALAALAFDWGIVGVWAALAVLIAVRLALMSWRFSGRRWLVTGWASAELAGSIPSAASGLRGTRVPVAPQAGVGLPERHRAVVVAPASSPARGRGRAAATNSSSDDAGLDAIAPTCRAAARSSARCR